MKFSELPLNEDVLKGLTDAGYVDCQPVQEAALPTALTGRDICAQAQTGSGKTAAFLVPIFQRFCSGELKTPDKALIVAPTRELALQIEEEAILLGRHLPVTVGCFYGGVGYDKQERMLKDNVNVIVGTPGRIIDHMQAGRIDFTELRMVVIDEADRLFDMGFLPDLRKMFKKMRKPAERQTMLLSATLSTRVKHLAWEYMNDPAEFEINPEKMTVDTISQTMYHVSTKEKMKILLGILRDDSPKNAIIFTNTKQAAYEVSHRLNDNGYASEYIIGDLPQNKRVQRIDSFKAGELKFLVATDVAARGIHVDDLEMVVNYDIPEDPESYVHRIGRTARVGKSGRAVSFACEKFVYGLEQLQTLINMEIPVVDVTEEMFAEDKSAGKRYRLERKGDRRDSRGGRSGGRGRSGGGRDTERRGAKRKPRPKKMGSRGGGGGGDARAAKLEEQEELNEFLGVDGEPQKPRRHRGGQRRGKKSGSGGDGQQNRQQGGQGSSDGQGDGTQKKRRRRRRRPPRKDGEAPRKDGQAQKKGQRPAKKKQGAKPAKKAEKKSIIKKIFGFFGKK